MNTTQTDPKVVEEIDVIIIRGEELEDAADIITTTILQTIENYGLSERELQRVLEMVRSNLKNPD
jgi:hypothetical protein